MFATLWNIPMVSMNFLAFGQRGWRTRTPVARHPIHTCESFTKALRDRCMRRWIACLRLGLGKGQGGLEQTQIHIRRASGLRLSHSWNPWWTSFIIIQFCFYFMDFIWFHGGKQICWVRSFVTPEDRLRIVIWQIYRNVQLSYTFLTISQTPGGCPVRSH